LKEWLRGVNYSANNDQVANLVAYKWLIAKEKAILTAINMMRPRNHNYIGFLWSPSAEEGEI